MEAHLLSSSASMEPLQSRYSMFTSPRCLLPLPPRSLSSSADAFHSVTLSNCFRSIPSPGFRSKPELRIRATSSSSQSQQSFAPRFIQHKQEAFWFYRFLSIIYDHIINPGHWTEDMRENALEPADLNDPNLTVVDVGGGTGFCTQGIVKYVDPKNVTILDQSPHQLAKARAKEDLKGCTIMEGDAEDLPFPTDSVDRYVSAGRYP